MQQLDQKFYLNLSILVECRKQIGLTQQQVKKKVGSIALIESGTKRPTYKQLDTLADLYQVPRWVFISKSLPKEYQYKNSPVFRKFKDFTTFDDAKIRQLVTKVQQYRELFIELRQDMDDSIKNFAPPSEISLSNISQTAQTVRNWLAIENVIDFNALKSRLEQENIFIFLTSKYNGWSHIDQSFRGLSVFYNKLPIIIINDSDSKKAQSFTLLHELGHILRGDTSIDGESTESTAIEQWCDQFAGEVLMPKASPRWQGFSDTNLDEVEQLAKQFKVSTYACLVRLKQLHKIDQTTYDNHVGELTRQYDHYRKQLKDIKKPIPRNRSKEVAKQFGAPFVNTVLNAWQSKELTLLKAIDLLDLKRSQQLFELGGKQ